MELEKRRELLKEELKQACKKYLYDRPTPDPCSLDIYFEWENKKGWLAALFQPSKSIKINQQNLIKNLELIVKLIIDLKSHCSYKLERIYLDAQKQTTNNY